MKAKSKSTARRSTCNKSEEATRAGGETGVQDVG